jgi:hypothetical protein
MVTISVSPNAIVNRQDGWLSEQDARELSPEQQQEFTRCFEVELAGFRGNESPEGDPFVLPLTRKAMVAPTAKHSSTLVTLKASGWGVGRRGGCVDTTAVRHLIFPLW